MPPPLRLGQATQTDCPIKAAGHKVWDEERHKEEHEEGEDGDEELATIARDGLRRMRQGSTSYTRGDSKGCGSHKVVAPSITEMASIDAAITLIMFKPSADFDWFLGFQVPYVIYLRFQYILFGRPWDFFGRVTMPKKGMPVIYQYIYIYS